MTRTSLDYYSFILGDKKLIITIYVDDLLSIEFKILNINKLIKLLSKRFEIKDIRVIIKYFSIEIKRRLDGIFLN